ncbi:sensor histidine kinase [Dactylosporangium matsuzakiense]|uniref:histidine kinase n=2 Tax=Dactylosporangium matsuzakiense TaxID=53360 RepID=A0A9W6KDT9_9ACTN|nr:CHASE3 domain-containing protein [Dactylosporangium matsuzakiense]GLL00212.1 histidine kinase [Dactylosporangium matsuzakiense]
MNPSSWSLWRRITMLCAVVAGLLVVIAVGATGTAAANRSETTQVMDRLTPALANTERLYAQLLRQQSSVRTYLLTGKDSDLDSYRDAQSQEAAILAETREQLTGETRLLTAVEDIAAATARYRREVTEPLIAQTRANGVNQDTAAPTDQARAVYNDAAGRINALSQRISQRRDDVAGQVRTSGNLLVLLLIFAAVVVVVAGVMLALLLRRLVTRPVTDLAREVRRVAGGDYEYQIRSAGPPELAELAGDVDAMRRRINADLTDVQEARRLVEEANRMLEQQAAELTRSNRDLEQFAYVASHDLQEPLRKVASFCQLLQRRYSGQLDERADQYIGFAVDGAQRMQRLINDLLAFSRIGRLTNGFTEVDLNKVVLDAAGQFDAQREATEAEIIFTDLPAVRGEEPLLGALFSNLIGNAIKFRRPGVPPRIVIDSRPLDDGEFEISVEDNGIGIEPEFADKVFVIFQRLHAKETYPGTGIGLAIAKKIVEYHGGRIWIDPDHREGTLFRFTLPVPAPVPALAEEPAA